MGAFGPVIAAALLLGAVLFAVRGSRRLVRGLRHAVSLEVIRGIRGWVVGAAMAACAVGVLWQETGFIVLGAVFLAEELYETGVVALVIRRGERVGRSAR